MNELKAYNLHMGPAMCAVDLSDGSERGLYVDQDYILRKLGRPHRAVNLMYCYYPLDKGWPGRASVVHANPDVQFAWDFPYDDYFTYKGGIGGDLSDEPFKFMRDVRRHGQDVILTLTADPNLTDDYLIAIAKDLRTFGRMLIRINHEATGNWFSFTKRTTYQGVADFFVRFNRIIKQYAPNVTTILCAGGIEVPEEGAQIEMEREFTEAFKVTDIWSIDKYLALHWGWPYDVAEKGGTTHSRSDVKEVYEFTRLTFERLKKINGGVAKPMVMSELNADADVTGPYDQAAMMREFAELVKNDPGHWFKAFTMYQFRDDGRLGLEITDPNNHNVGIEQPLMKEYKNIIHEDFFSPEMTMLGEVKLPVKLRWGGSEDAEGIAIALHFEKNPHFAEAYFDGELENMNLMLELGGTWFYKAPGVKCIDMMSAFFEKPVTEACDLTLKIFAPPASGENDPAQGDDWQTNYYTTLPALPRIRLEFEPIIP
ncbi:MAG: hypothetical protein IKN24_05070 [Lachnospiraceae bacterium]|nr:hypothetical protein [Lachnospiraceae bacterium]